MFYTNSIVSKYINKYRKIIIYLLLDVYAINQKLVNVYNNNICISKYLIKCLIKCL